jgi:hypothetical protein
MSHETAGRPSGCPHKAGMTGLLLVAALLLASTSAHADGVSPQGALMVANVAGECDVLYSMVAFQKKNNIKGGEEYVAKFWESEAAQMNLSVDQLSARCEKTAAAYDKLYNSSAPAQARAAHGNE